MTDVPDRIPKRINVAVSVETVAALEAAIERDGISLTDAVNKLIRIGHEISVLSKVERAQILAVTDNDQREVLIL